MSTVEVQNNLDPNNYPIYLDQAERHVYFSSPHLYILEYLFLFQLPDAKFDVIRAHVRDVIRRAV